MSSGGTSGCVVAGRLAEDADVSILIIEAGEHSDKIELTQMPCGLVQLDASLSITRS